MKSTNQHSQNPQNSNQKDPHERSDTRKHQYKDFDDVLKNDENYDEDTQKFKGEQPDEEDKMNNEEKK